MSKSVEYLCCINELVAKKRWQLEAIKGLDSFLEIFADHELADVSNEQLEKLRVESDRVMCEASRLSQRIRQILGERAASAQGGGL